MYPTGALASRSLQQMVRTDGACGCGCRLRLAPPRRAAPSSTTPAAERGVPAPHAATAPRRAARWRPAPSPLSASPSSSPRRQIRRGGASARREISNHHPPPRGGSTGGGRIESGRARAGSPAGGGCPRRRRRRIRFDLDHAAFACSLFFFAWLLFFFSPLVEMEEERQMVQMGGICGLHPEFDWNFTEASITAFFVKFET